MHRILDDKKIYMCNVIYISRKYLLVDDVETEKYVIMDFNILYPYPNVKDIKNIFRRIIFYLWFKLLACVLCIYFFSQLFVKVYNMYVVRVREMETKSCV